MLDDIDHNNYAKTLVVKMFLLNTTQGIQLTELSAHHSDATIPTYPHLPNLPCSQGFPARKQKKRQKAGRGLGMRLPSNDTVVRQCIALFFFDRFRNGVGL